MQSTSGHLVSFKPNQLVESGGSEASAIWARLNGLHDFNHQCLRILRCTAKAMANSPGGLRFKAGTRPWLEGLSVVRPVLVTCSGRLLESNRLTADD